MTGRGASQDDDRQDRGRAAGRLLLVGALALAFGAAAVLVLSDNARWLRLAVVAALWAALVGAFLAARYRRQVVERDDEVADLQSVYELELEREVAARREYELELEAETRKRVREEAKDDLEALRGELRALRENLEALLGGEVLVERVALRAESTRMRSLSDQSRLMGLGDKRIITAGPVVDKPAAERPEVRTEMMDRVVAEAPRKEQPRRPEPARPEPARQTQPVRREPARVQQQRPVPPVVRREAPPKPEQTERVNRPKPQRPAPEPVRGEPVRAEQARGEAARDTDLFRTPNKPPSRSDGGRDEFPQGGDPTRFAELGPREPGRGSGAQARPVGSAKTERRSRIAERTEMISRESVADKPRRKGAESTGSHRPVAGRTASERTGGHQPVEPAGRRRVEEHSPQWEEISKPTRRPEPEEPAGAHADGKSVSELLAAFGGGDSPRRRRRREG
ncbi:DUF6779 domain-containing protein [Saccharothrix coeruleofusca]|nr:DUF6779 domain-containing protein [Saccharothrix coeruleofusca]MBP2340365.1 hypothetical protein [Saccharothrix coeruleofusca]